MYIFRENSIFGRQSFWPKCPILAENPDFRPFLGWGSDQNRFFFREKSMTAIELGVVFGRIGAIYDAQSLINWFLCTYFEKNSIFGRQSFWPKCPILAENPDFWPFLGWGSDQNRIFFREKSMTAIELGVVFGCIGAIYDA